MKLKLEIQRFNSSNQTTHYDLSQYLANDKPTYLIDYNGDMAKIDTAIYGADSRSLVNETSIGDLTELETTAKNNLVSAVNEIKSATDTNTSNISTNTSNIASLGDDLGDLVNLTTTAKNNLVSAVNELKGVNDTQNTNISSNTTQINNIKNLLNLSDVKTYTYANFTNVSNLNSSTGISITIAQDTTGEIIKVYGTGNLYRAGQTGNDWSFTIPNALNNSPDTDYQISPSGITFGLTNKAFYGLITLTVKSNGSLTVSGKMPTNENLASVLFPCVYFNSDFGDEPYVPVE